jgi:hypothetical protein
VVSVVRRTEKRSFGLPAGETSDGPAKILRASASRSCSTDAKVDSFFGGREAIVDPESSSSVAKRSFPESAGSRSKRLGRVRRPPREVGEAIGWRRTGSFAVVEEPEPAFALIHEVIRAVADEHDAGALRHLEVIGDVEDQLREHPVFDPAVKYRNERLPVDGSRRIRGDEDFELEFLRVHAARDWPLSVESNAGGTLAESGSKARIALVGGIDEERRLLDQLVRRLGGAILPRSSCARKK